VNEIYILKCEDILITEISVGAVKKADFMGDPGVPKPLFDGILAY
jgi:hypothetical protein